jgi:DNA polymerase-3 subunit beta
MKLTVTRKELYEGLQIVGRVVSAHTSLPVLKNVLIQPGESGLTLSATDLELSVEVRVPANVQEAGAITVPSRTFGEIVAALPEADVTLASGDEERMLISCRRSEYRIHALGAEDFPSLPEVGGQVTLRLPQPMMKSMIRQTALAASTDDTRPILTGISLSVEDGNLRLVATDTHRLAVSTRSLNGAETTGETKVIVPARALNELMRVLEDGEESMLEVRVDQNQILFHTDRVTLVSRLIEGQFPPYQRVIPSQYTRRLTIPRDEFASSLRRARIVARDAAAKGRVTLHTSGENLIISAEADEGRAHEEVEVVREGDDIEIAFSAEYVLETLGVIDSEGVFLELTEPLNPAVLRPVEADDYLMIVMPMQVR